MLGLSLVFSLVRDHAVEAVGLVLKVPDGVVCVVEPRDLLAASRLVVPDLKVLCDVGERKAERALESERRVKDRVHRSHLKEGSGLKDAAQVILLGDVDVTVLTPRVGP